MILSIFFISVGVQIAYFAIIGTQLSMIMLSIVLMFGIYRVSSMSNLMFVVTTYK